MANPGKAAEIKDGRSFKSKCHLNGKQSSKMNKPQWAKWLFRRAPELMFR